MFDVFDWHLLSQRLVVMLIHFVWQGLFGAIVLAAILRFVPRDRPRIRYATSAIVLFSLPMIAVATFWQTSSSERGDIRLQSTFRQLSVDQADSRLRGDVPTWQSGDESEGDFVATVMPDAQAPAPTPVPNADGAPTVTATAKSIFKSMRTLCIRVLLARCFLDVAPYQCRDAGMSTTLPTSDSCKFRPHCGEGPSSRGKHWTEEGAIDRGVKRDSSAGRGWCVPPDRSAALLARDWLGAE